MATALTAPQSPSAVHDKFEKGPGLIGTLIFVVVLIIGVSYIGYSLSRDLIDLHMTSALPYILLGTVLFVALGFRIRQRLP
jgi:inorganic phosphate transporter, PiT family